MLATIYIIALVLLFILIWLRHFYLVYKLNAFMLKYHQLEWTQLLKQKANWFGLEPWPSSLAFTFYSKVAYDFIWRSEEYFGDTDVKLQKQRIRRFTWELVLYFVMAISLTLLLIITGVLR